MLNNSSDVSRKMNSKENLKKCESHDETLNLKFEQNDFIPLDKELSLSKGSIRHQRDRSQQRIAHHRTSYYNTNRNQNRGVFSGNNLSVSNTLKGNHNRNPHSNYTGHFSNSYQNSNGAPNNYNRSKRKRDSSAISTQYSKNQMKNGSITSIQSDVSIDSQGPCGTSKLNVENDYHTKNGVSGPLSSNESSPKKLGPIPIDEVYNDCNLKGTKTHHKHNLPKELEATFDKVDSNQATEADKKFNCTHSTDLSKSHTKRGDEPSQGSHQNVFSVSKTNEDFKKSNTRHEETENEKAKKALNINCQTRFGNEILSRILPHHPVWYRGKPYGGGIIG